MQTIDISELTPKILELLGRGHPGEELFITDKEHPVAKLILVSIGREPEPKDRKIGLSKSIVWMSPDFNEPLEDFAEYMQ
ncbi:MAG: type II toxin-antitoxin system prevent-host-death family antitoxin [Blastocatellia bacterium]|nr:type II toxin-antitoxin system prevent-host-death family antitoxin [Blastocatellia bacterium]